ncbi:MAG: ATP12 family chaperone protein [Roseiarcus sp.]
MSDPNPIRAAQANMRGPEIKRFYANATVEQGAHGWALKLDGRAARTPGKAPLVAPTRAIAELVAAEFNAQRERIEPVSMPVTRLANSAIDGVAKTILETRAAIARYAGSDLVCYRAENPAELVALQAAAHDPMLAWAERELGARFTLGVGVIHVEQPAATLERFAAALAVYDDPFALAALFTLTSLSGSALIALALARGAFAPEAAWSAAHVDEDFQIAKWGEDREAAERRAARRNEFWAAARVARGV